MYSVIDGGCLDSEHATLNSALARALELALEQADHEGINREVITTFVNGREGYDSFEAGAGPENCDCAGWPHVEIEE